MDASTFFQGSNRKIMRLFGKKKKEKGWGAGDDFSGTASGRGGGGGGGVLHISIVGDGMDSLHFPPPAILIPFPPSSSRPVDPSPSAPA